ncbi:T9SS type A sorting domain-containing protein [Rufibacter immobilis]|uniref:T9SS type A sorting domain-containing protein n=1 Tax=Rufibacter immobilis TaxID=1348778 RepID=UPI0035E88733
MSQVIAESALKVVSIKPSINTGQDYSPWLDENLSNLVKSVWAANNNQYVEVVLALESKSTVTRVSLYDHQGTFTTNPAYVYAQNGSEKVLIGTFDGKEYLKWVDFKPSAPVTAEAIIIRKYGNNIPQKVKIYGQAGTTTAPPAPAPSPAPQQAVITFNALPARKVGDAPFVLKATSTNTATPITFTSSNKAVVTVANTSKGWEATIIAAGNANITAAQAAGNNFTAASNVTRTQVVEAADVTEPIPAPVPAPAPAPAPGTGTVVQGDIPYKAYWGYHKDNSTQNMEALFNGVVKENVHMGFSEMLTESDIVLSFPDQMEVELQRISFYDGEGSLSSDATLRTIFIERGTGKEIKGPDYTGSEYNKWLDHTLGTPVKVSAVILRKKKGARLPDEIKFYGKYKTYAAPTYVKPAYALKRLLGINTYPYDNYSKEADVQKKRTAAIAPYHLVRDYVDWGILETSEGEYGFSPTLKGTWPLDEIYARHKANGKEVLVCLKNIPEWLKSTYPAAIQSEENAPMPYKSTYTTASGGTTNYFNAQYDADKLKPATYLKVAKLAFQFAARYGANTSVNPALVKVTSKVQYAGAPANKVQIGLDLVDKMEANNEADRYWKGRQAYQNSDEYAAYLSAFYDGHMGTLGADVGVKQADPNMIVVCGGIASTKTAFYQGIVDWCKKNRGYLPDGRVNLCFDEINYHAYNNNQGGDQYAGGPRVGVAPELSVAPSNIYKFHQVNKEFIGGLPIIITETGYDWNSATQGTKVIGSKDKFAVQGDWILRSSLEYAMSGLSGLYFYQLYDDGSGSSSNTTQYMTSGHVERNTFKRRPAADYIGQVGKQFGDFVPVERLSNDPRVDKYRDNGGKAMFACWIPDEKDRRSDYTLNLGTDSANVYTLQIGNEAMAVKRMKTNSGKITLTLTETPVFVEAAGKLLVSATKSSEIQMETPQSNRLAVYPNPFAQQTTLEFMLVEDSEAVLDLYDGQGRVVKRLFVGKIEGGVTQTAQLNAIGLANGVYIARLTTGKTTLTQKVLLMN